MANLLLVSLSAIREPRKTAAIYDSDQGAVTGTYTPDAAADYFLRMLLHQGQTLDKILCIATAETLSPIPGTKLSAYELFQDTVTQRCAAYGCPLPEFFPIPNTFSAFHIAEPIRDIFSHIHTEDHIFLDTTGGARNTSYLLLFLMRFLEYDNVHLERAVYSSLGGSTGRNAILDVTDLYRMFNLMNAANTFTAFGNADELESIFHDHENPVIHRVIDAMHQFSDAVSLCRTNLDATLRELNDSLSALSAEQLTDENGLLFQRIIGIIRKKFYLTDGKTNIGYPDIIRWCLDNNLLQQAITIYVEKLPDYLLEQGFFQASPEAVQTVKEKKSIYPLGYELFYNGFLRQYAEKGHAPNALAEFFRQCSKRHMQYIAEATSISMLRQKMQLPASTENPELFKGLTRFYQLRNILFDRYGSPRAKSAAVLPPEYAPYAKRLRSYNTPKSFLNAAANEPAALLAAIQGNTQPKAAYQNDRLNTIAQLETLLRESTSYRLGVFLSVSEMQQIAKDYLYLKSFVRNMVNHAGDDMEHLNEYAAYFAAAGYDTDHALQTKNIKKILLRSIGKIQEIERKKTI